MNLAQVLQNPVVWKAGAVFLLTAAVLLAGLIVLRMLRRQLVPAAEKPARPNENAAFSLMAYESVIRKMKEQERELEGLRRTERERASESASISEAVLANLASGVVLFNPNRLVRQANPAARALLGFASPTGLHPRDVFRGVTAVRFESVAKAESLPQAIDLCITQGTLFRRIEADHTTPAGERRVLGITLSPVRSTKGEPLGVAALISDLTEITALSGQMRLRENLAALGEMSAGIAHEFKNSLATISGYAQMLSGSPPTPETRDFAARIAAETDSLSRIVTDFLNFAKPQEFHAETVALKPLLEAAAQAAHVRLRFVAPAEDLSLRGDEVALRQVFSNLFRNSAEAVIGDGEPAVEVSLRQDARTLQVILKDNGAGIPVPTLEKIFIPFFTTKSQGTGLGLALVHRIITEHGGTIVAKSAGEGQGTTFTLGFPTAGTAAAPGKPE